MSNESVVQFEKENSDQKVSNENHESHASEHIRINQENNASVNSKENEILFKIYFNPKLFFFTVKQNVTVIKVKVYEAQINFTVYDSIK
jgi:hypothetical protein